MSRDRSDDDDDFPRRPSRPDEDDDRPRRSRRDEDDPPPRRRRDYDDGPPPKKSGKTLWIVLGILGGVLLVCGGAGVWGFFKWKDSTARMVTSNNLHQLSIAAASYNDSYGKLPGPCVDDRTVGAFGSGRVPANPSDRLSWRYSILPFIEQNSLYQMMDPSQAWNAGANQSASSAGIKTYGDPQDPSDNRTRFRCFYDNGALWDTDPAKRVSLSYIPDGSSNTIMFVEAGERVPWAQFNELKFDPDGSPPQLGHPSRDVVMVGMADGSVKSVKKTVSPAVLKAAITRAGNDDPGPDFR